MKVLWELGGTCSVEACKVLAQKWISNSSLPSNSMWFGFPNFTYCHICVHKSVFTSSFCLRHNTTFPEFWPLCYCIWFSSPRGFISNMGPCLLQELKGIPAYRAFSVTWPFLLRGPGSSNPELRKPKEPEGACTDVWKGYIWLVHWKLQQYRHTCGFSYLESSQSENA